MGGVAARPGPTAASPSPVHPLHRATSTARHGPVGGRSTYGPYRAWSSPTARPPRSTRVRRRGRCRRPAPTTVGTSPVVVVVDEQRHGSGSRRRWPAGAARSSASACGRPRVDGVAVEGEDDRHDVRPAGPVGRRQAGHAGHGEPAAGLDGGQAAGVRRRRGLVRTARWPGAQPLPFGLSPLGHPRVAGRPGFQADLEPALALGGPLAAAASSSSSWSARTVGGGAGGRGRTGLALVVPGHGRSCSCSGAPRRRHRLEHGRPPALRTPARRPIPSALRRVPAPSMTLPRRTATADRANRNRSAAGYFSAGGGRAVEPLLAAPTAAPAPFSASTRTSPRRRGRPPRRGRRPWSSARRRCPAGPAAGAPPACSG